MSRTTQGKLKDWQSFLILLIGSGVFACGAYILRDDGGPRIMAIIAASALLLLALIFGLRSLYYMGRSAERLQSLRQALATPIGALCVLLLLVTLAGGYWFGYRPYAVRADCSSKAEERSGITDENWHYRAYNTEAQGDYMFMYEACVQYKGLEG